MTTAASLVDVTPKANRICNITLGSEKGVERLRVGLRNILAVACNRY
jgi:hypothetical protein